MKFSELHFESDRKEEESAKKFKSSVKDGYLRRCFGTLMCYGNNGYLYDSHKEEADRCREIMRNANTVDDFIDAFVSDESFAGTQAYGAVICLERPNDRWIAIRKMFGEKQFKTISDAGCVKVGNSDFCVMIQNGRGDGCTRCAVFGKNDLFNSELFGNRIDATISGKAGIYSYDCGNDVEREIEGKFFVYSYDGFVAFKEID